MINLTVKITKEVLEKTKHCNTDGMIGRNCAIGFAIGELWEYGWTGLNSISIYGNAEDFRHSRNAICYIELPMAAIDFVSSFDRKNPSERVAMPELTFDIEVPDEALQGIDISEVYRILENSKTLKLVK